MSSVQNRPGVWAVGDCAEIPKANGKETYAPTAQNATREGTWLARNVNAVLRGRVPRPFRYKMLGQLALLSHRRAIADLLGLKIEGFIAWAIWWAIYTLKLP
ncbi:NADH dehydrogenase [Acidisarcina polymorpha]|uniref:NADH:ubiquinone reductase (non-electrogenic) n=1 Tax=Acidisarcina polymorpha TaxID=2211140 RepID=A0A2Z5FZB2_9BACT|nr:NADH dehydrogenase [Acidisarcina polymorpha]